MGQMMFEDGAFKCLKVLVVDDNKYMRSLLNAMLGSIGITDTLQASDGKAAIEVLLHNSCDIVFTDMTMQPMDGLSFTRALRASAAGANAFVPVIMITGNTEKYRVQEARDAGVNEFLAKPITTGALHERIASVVQNPRPFVRCENFFGPDRRRQADEARTAGLRREQDRDTILI